MDRHDALALALQQLGDRVRRAARVAEPDDGPRLALVEHQVDPLLPLPVAHPVHLRLALMSASSGNDFPLFALSEEHQAIREAVRDLCEAKVAPYAAAVDEEARYPRGGGRGPAGRRLPRPARPGGVRRRGRRRARHRAGDRGDRAGVHDLVADPRGQQARLDAGDPGGLGGAAEEVPDQARLRRGRLLLLPVRARRRLRRRRDEDARGPRRRRLGARRREAVDHQRRGLGVLHGDGGDRSRRRAPRASRRSSSRSPTRASRSGRRRRSSASRAARPARSTSTRSGSPPTG